MYSYSLIFLLRAVEVMSPLPVYALSTQQNGVLPSEYLILPDEYPRRKKATSTPSHSLSCKTVKTLPDLYRTSNRIFHALDFCLVCCGMFSLICSVLPPTS